jgi:hypothetical protein
LATASSAVVGDQLLLRTEPASTTKPRTRLSNTSPTATKLSSIVGHYLEEQHDIVEAFVDRTQLQKLSQPTLPPQWQT